MQPIDVLYDPKAGKAALREALAMALGVAMPEAVERESSLFTNCNRHFGTAYKKHTGLTYRFGARDGMALSSILSQLRSILADKSDTAVQQAFVSLIDHLPDWYKQNQFNLPVIDKKFNDIVSSIKHKNHGTTTSDDYKRKVLNDLLA